jgi:hypothetical protein
VTIDFGYPTNPSYTLLFVLFCLAIRGRLLRAGRDGWPPTLIGAALLLPLCVVLAGLVHWHGAKPIVVGIAPLLCIGVLCWHLIEEARRDPRLIRRIAEAFTWFSVAVAVFAKYQGISGTWPIFDQLAYDWIYTSMFDPTRSVGISGHPIVYGTFAMGMALVALTIRGKYWYVPFAANLVGLVLSGTRSAWLGLLLALTAWLLSRWRTLSWRGVASAAAIAAITFAIVAVKPPAGTFHHSSSASTPNSSTRAPHSVDSVHTAAARMADPMQSASASARFTRIVAAWDGITHDWSTIIFGYGPEANVRYLEHTGVHDGEAQVFDNTYLSIWYNFGIIGVVCLIFVLFEVYRRFLSLAPRLMFVAFAAQIFFFDVWLWLGAVAVLLLAVGLGAADNPAWSRLPLRTLAPGGRRIRPQGVHRRSAKRPLAEGSTAGV